MANSFVHTGFRVPVVSASGTIGSGAIVVQEGMAGVAQTSIFSGQSGWLGVSGVWNLPVPAGTVKGDALYVSGANPPAETNNATLTKSSTGNTLFGVAQTDRDGLNRAHVYIASAPVQQSSTSGVQFADMGTPDAADDDFVVTSRNMANGTYPVASGTLDVPRNIVVTTTAAGSADTQGTVTVAGTNAVGAAIQEVIIPVAGTPVAGLKAFKTVTSVTQAGWVIAAGNDTIKVGTGDALGLPVALTSATQIIQSYINRTATADFATADGTVEGTTIDVSSGTYDGSSPVSVQYQS